jgi:hypothetical protein
MIPEAMIRNIHVSILLVFSAFLLSRDSPDRDFVKLFNGKDLSGWEVKNGSAPFTVQDGMIVGTCLAGTLNTFLCTEETYEFR